MPRQRSPERERAFELWRDSDGKRALRDIALELGVPEKSVSGWKAKDAWPNRLNGVRQMRERSTPKRKGGAPKGSRNAAGNIGGHGGPVGNKKAVVTGEHETISWDMLDADEQALYRLVSTEELAAIDRTIRVMELRERRMLKRIKGLQDGPGMVDQLATESTQTSDQLGASAATTVTREAAVDRIQRIEDALTRIQEKKGKYIELRAKLVPQEVRDQLERLRMEKLKAEIAKLTGTGGDDDEADDGFLDALSAEAEAVWGGEDDGEEE